MCKWVPWKHGRSLKFPVDIYLFKAINSNTRKRCEICLKLTIMSPERHHCRCSGVFVVNFDHIPHLLLGFVFDFEQGPARCINMLVLTCNLIMNRIKRSLIMFMRWN